MINDSYEPRGVSGVYWALLAIWLVCLPLTLTLLYVSTPACGPDCAEATIMFAALIITSPTVIALLIAHVCLLVCLVRVPAQQRWRVLQEVAIWYLFAIVTFALLWSQPGRAFYAVVPPVLGLAFLGVLPIVWIAKRRRPLTANAQTTFKVVARIGQLLALFSIWLYLFAVLSFNLVTTFDMGMKLYKMEQYTAARWIWQKVAARTEPNPRGWSSEGGPAAKFWLGTIYENGRGVAPDEAAAARWFDKALDARSEGARLWRQAQRGDSRAQYMLGLGYFGIPYYSTPERSHVDIEDYEVGMRWFRRSAEQGNPDARRLLDGLAHNQAR
jgi:Sel1 repeat